MKAWLVKERDEFCATVVFAETRGKAKSAAMNTDVCAEPFRAVSVEEIDRLAKRK